MTLPMCHTSIYHHLNSPTFMCLKDIRHYKQINKSKSKLIMANYKPVSVLSTLSEIYEHAHHRQVYWYLNFYGLINEYQCSFRCGHTTALLGKISTMFQQYSLIITKAFGELPETEEYHDGTNCAMSVDACMYMQLVYNRL